jgi:hypothetical protein
MREAKTVYYDKIGPENTDDTLRLSKQRADELGIKTIVLASSTGATALKALEVFDGMKVVAVSYFTGFRDPGEQRFLPENREKFEAKGGTVVTMTHAFGGLNSAVRDKFSTHLFGDIMANTLRIFGHGMKVAAEVTMMATDAGQTGVDEEIIAIAGKGKGADTAIVVSPINVARFFDMKVKEIICKPRL